MGSKLLTIGLLIFVGASLVVPFVRRARQGADEPTQLEVGPVHSDRTLVYYFHSHVRCPACRTVELQSRATVQREFAAPLQAGKIAWQSVNYQSPGNEHFVADFQLVAASVVVVEVKNGQPRTWKTLHEAWNLTGDPAALAAYFQREIAASLEGRP